MSLHKESESNGHTSPSAGSPNGLSSGNDGTKRNLRVSHAFSRLSSAGSLTTRVKPRHIQLISMGGAVGTIMFVQIGSALSIGGPGSLFVAFLLWSTVLLAVNTCLAEMVCWLPISSPFVRFADRFVDEALGVVSGLNFFIYIAIGIPFEMTAANLMLQFWTDRIPVAAVIVFMIVAYAAFNVFAVRLYGEVEFWLAIGKIVLAVGLLLFTLVVALGGNPEHDRFGFRNWDSSKVSGAPFVPYVFPGATGRFIGFLSCLVEAAFTMQGPEYIAMTAGEAAQPRRTMYRSFSSITFRLVVFFVFGTLSVGVLVPHSDPALLGASGHVKRGSGTSPYVIAMTRLRIPVLPHVVNALVLLSIFSAGNSYVYTASRTLYGMALEGQVPRVFARCSKRGVPIYAVGASMLFSSLAFLQLNRESAVILQWISLIATVGLMINYALISLTYLRFRAALAEQNVPRSTLPWVGRLQPFCGYYALITCTTMIFLSGYAVFLPGHWSVTTFVFSYVLILILPLVFLTWKFTKRTKASLRKVSEIDLFKRERGTMDDRDCI
ncbi:unnamed protein product [Mycena citricolor]|uniref:Amino acid permease/ SLC12A domain-containing protein n=1 Tax=Mycena citricolor TaxID=2018698 RepID=A0AAD2K0D9_9AGAR|nr:unnamed protein product [Mycena citricolor]